MLISQTFRGSPELDKRGYYLLQKWYRLSNEQKHGVIKELADDLRSNLPGHIIRGNLERNIDRFVTDPVIDGLKY